MVLEVNVRLRDEDGARWMHNETPKEKGISVEFLEFCGDGPGCDILSPLKYRPQKKSDGSYRFVDDDNTKGIVGQEDIRSAGNDGKFGTKDDMYFIPQEGYFRFAVPKDKLDALDVVTIKLTDAADNSVSFEGDDPDREASTLKTITKSLSLDKDQKARVGALEEEMSFFVTNDDKLSRLLIGSIPVGGVSVYDQFITNVGQFFRRSAAMLGWALEITNEGYRNGKIEALALVIRNIVNGLIILAIMGIAALWIFSALIPAQVVRRSTTLILISAIVVNFAMPVMRLVLDGAGIVQRTFLNREMTDDRFLRIENISDVWVGTGAMVLQPRSMKQGDESIDDFVDLDDRYVDMRQESTYFHGFLLIALALGEILVSIVLALRIVILWFFLILSPFLAVLPVFHFTRGVFRYWIWLFGRWLFLGPLIAMCLFISISIWQHTGIPIESSFEGFAGTSFLSNTTNIQMYAPGVIHGEGGNMGSATELMKFIIGILMVWFSVIVPFWLTRSKILSACCGGGKDKQSITVPKKSLFSPLLPQKSEPSAPGGGGEKPALAMRTGSHFDLKFPEREPKSPVLLSKATEGIASLGTEFLASEKTERIPEGISVSLPNAKVNVSLSEKEFTALGQKESESTSTSTVAVQNMGTKEIIDRLEHAPASVFANVVADQEHETFHSELESRATTGDTEAFAYLQAQGNATISASSSEETESSRQKTQATSMQHETGEAIHMEDLQSEELSHLSESSNTQQETLAKTEPEQFSEPSSSANTMAMGSSETPGTDIENSNLGEDIPSLEKSTIVESSETSGINSTQETEEISSLENIESSHAGAYTVEGMGEGFDDEPVEEVEYATRSQKSASAQNTMTMEQESRETETEDRQSVGYYGEEASSGISNAIEDRPVMASYSAPEQGIEVSPSEAIGSEVYTVENMDGKLAEQIEYQEVYESPVLVAKEKTSKLEDEDLSVPQDAKTQTSGIQDSTHDTEEENIPELAAEGKESEVAREFAALNAKSSQLFDADFGETAHLPEDEYVPAIFEKQNAREHATEYPEEVTETVFTVPEDSSHNTASPMTDFAEAFQSLSSEAEDKTPSINVSHTNDTSSTTIENDSEKTEPTSMNFEGDRKEETREEADDRAVPIVLSEEVDLFPEEQNPEVSATGAEPETAREMADEEKKIVEKSENVSLKKQLAVQSSEKEEEANTLETSVLDSTEEDQEIEEEAIESIEEEQKNGDVSQETEEELNEEEILEDEEVLARQENNPPQSEEQEIAQNLWDEEEISSLMQNDSNPKS